jgi:hypothetical protein
MYSVSAPAIQAQPVLTAAAQQPRNARFWVIWNADLVKLTLAPGQRLSLFHAERHEEGWHCIRKSFEHTGEAILQEIHNDGTDCDGRLTYSSTSACPLAELGAFVSDCCKEPLPRWTVLESEQRDFSAEAAGY